jgi:hypothetical protein
VGEVLLVAQGELEGAQRQPRGAGDPGDGRLDRAGAAGDDDVDLQGSRLGSVGGRHQRCEVGDLGVADHEPADQVGVLRAAVLRVLGDRLLEWHADRREDRSVVDERGQERWDSHGCHRSQAGR